MLPDPLSLTILCCHFYLIVVALGKFPGGTLGTSHKLPVFEF